MIKTACFVFSESKNKPKLFLKNDYESMIKEKILFANANFGVTNFVCNIKSSLDLATAKCVLDLKNSLSKLCLTCLIERNMLIDEKFKDECFPIIMHSDKKLVFSSKTNENDITKMMYDSSDVTILICDNNLIDFSTNKSKIVKKAYFIENKKRTI